MRRSIPAFLQAKTSEVVAFWRHSRTPLALTLDTLKLKSAPFVAVSADSLKLRLKPRSGESFTFFENLVRRDYLDHGIALHRGQTVIDVGANIGAFTVLAASTVGPTGRVVAVEPIAETYDRLRANVQLNGLANVVALRAAVGEHEGTLRLRVGSKSAYASACGADGVAPGELVEDVACVTLGRLLDEQAIDGVALLKVDCEGGEYGLFRSLTPALAARIDQIAMEVHVVDGELIEALAATIDGLGFELARFGMNWVAFNRGRGAVG